MEIIGSGTITYMMYDKELQYNSVHFNTDYKNGSDQKRVNSRFFMKKSERLKKIFFYKSPQNGQILFARFIVQKWNQKIVHQQFNVKDVTMLLAELYIKINNFDTD